MRIESQRMVVPQLDLKKIDPALVEAAQGMEANFLKQMIKVMRDSVPAGEDADNRAIQLFQGMLDESYADRTARTQGIGIAEMIIRHLTQQVEVAPPRRNDVTESSLVGEKTTPKNATPEWHTDESVKNSTPGDRRG